MRKLICKRIISLNYLLQVFDCAILAGLSGSRKNQMKVRLSVIIWDKRKIEGIRRILDAIGETLGGMFQTVHEDH